MPTKPKHGTFLPWTSIKPHTRRLHDAGVQHLIDIWPDIRARTSDDRFWGDEVEYQVIRLDDATREAHIVPRQDEILAELEGGDEHGEYEPEFTKFQVESSPSEPYDGGVESLLSVETSLANRRNAIKDAARSGESPFTLSNFPLLGVEELTRTLPVSPDDSKTEIFKEAVAAVGRHHTLRHNLETRRGTRYKADVPLFVDENTPLPSADSSSAAAATNGEDVHKGEGDIVKRPELEQPVIHLEDIVFSMGGCGLQATFQSKSLADVRTLHDRLCVLGPILLALTASTAIYKGRLAATDARWNQACSMVDDRRPDELKSLSPRWSCSPCYISESGNIPEGYQNADLARDERLQAQLEAGGLDKSMALYFANLHQRDPLVLFAQDEDGANGETESSNEAEDPMASVSAEQIHQSICGSVWSHVRLKVPGASSTAPAAANGKDESSNEDVKTEEQGEEGWRVEFRPMEVQLTDFSNAAFLVFMQLLRRALTDADAEETSPEGGNAVDLYVPLHLVEDNMERAHARDAVTNEKFWFRRDLRRPSRQKSSLATKDDGEESAKEENDVVLMSVDEIINGSSRPPSSGEPSFEGLIPFIRNNLSKRETADNAKKLNKYLDFVSARASGREKTPARWQRDFVMGHGEYRSDSVVTTGMVYDMLSAVKAMMDNAGSG